MNINIKLDHPDAKIPSKAHPTDAGFDLACVSIKVSEDFIEYDTGVIVEVPKNHVGLVFPRSSISKYDLALKNSIAVIDNGYLGTIKLRFSTLKKNENKIYVVGDRIGQLIILPYPEFSFTQVETFDKTDRNDGSFGSSGV